MSFKIYTYNDPYRLKDASFWNEISTAPHLFSSQVMVNGFRELFEHAFGSLMCPIDNVVKNVYDTWFNNIERKISQYIAITKQLDEWMEQGEIQNLDLYNSLKHNQNSILEAMRLFVELGIDCPSIKATHANQEQHIFINLMEKTTDPSSHVCRAFSLLGNHDKGSLAEAFKKTFDDEIKREENEIEKQEIEKQEIEINGDSVRKKRVSNLKLIRNDFTVHNLNKVVVHGIHQFTPLQLRFISLLDSLDVEVIFLFNYEPEFKGIYSTWIELYRLFDVPIEHDTNLGRYPAPFTSKSNNLAVAFAKLVEPSSDQRAQDRIQWFNAGQNVEMICFENITEYAGFVSKFFDQAIKRDKINPIANMNEQVYSAGREVHDLLRIYYPEHSGDRHFLSYPIGQFFLGLYRIWEPSINEIRLDWDSIRECLAAGILRISKPGRLNAALQTTKMFFSDIKTYAEFKGRIDEYKARYMEAQNLQSPMGSQLKKISIYHAKSITMSDIGDLETAIENLNSIAVYLFKNGEENNISFMEHFRRLEDFIRNEVHSFVEVEEKKLVSNLLERFHEVSSNTSLSGSIADLRNGLYYYLRQQDKENPDWIVRNFVQIEGDVLRSRRQKEKSNKGEEVPVYHFACLSDRMMNQTNDNLLPWPLNDYFISNSSVTSSLIFQIYYTAVSDYSRFLRYAFFYGLYFNECKVRLSYVLNVEDNEEQPFFPLRMLGISPKREFQNEMTDLQTSPQQILGETANALITNRMDYVDFLVCPYKYYLDMVCRGEIVIDSEFNLRRFFSNMLVDAVWREMQNRPRTNNISDQISRTLSKIEAQYKKYFPFWKNTNDFFDMRKVAENYILNNLFHNGVFKAYEVNHMNIRFSYWKAVFVSEEIIVHPYNSFNQKISNVNGEWKKSLHSIKDRTELELLNGIKSYMEDKVTHAVAGEWCVSCAHQKLCMKPYELQLDVAPMEES